MRRLKQLVFALFIVSLGTAAVQSWTSPRPTLDMVARIGTLSYGSTKRHRCKVGEFVLLVTSYITVTRIMWQATRPNSTKGLFGTVQLDWPSSIRECCSGQIGRSIVVPVPLLIAAGTLDCTSHHFALCLALAAYS
jgi:hypothetical protein